MDRNVTVRFFTIEATATATAMSAGIQRISQLGLPDREAEVGDEVFVRLERMEAMPGDVTCGELIRRQTSNLPPKALVGQPVESLGIQSIGHSSAFLYDPHLSILVFEQARNGITSTRFGMYVEHFNTGSRYDILPIPTQEMWDTLRTGRLRAMRVRCAAPQSLEAADAETEGVKAGLVALQHATNTHYIETRVGMVRGDPDIERRRALNWFNWFRRERENHRGEITKVYADIIPEGATQVQEINLLLGQIYSRQRLNLPEDDPVASYQIRAEFIRDALRKHRPALVQRYQR